MRKQVFFLSGAASQPRLHKRAEQLSCVADVTVFAFRRGYYEQNQFPEGTKVINLGRVTNRQYVRRIPILLNAIRIIRKELQKVRKADVLFYATNVDTLCIAKLVGLKQGFYEVGDLRAAADAKAIFRWLEKRVIRGVSGLVVTSPDFITGHYEKLGIDSEKVFLIENKLHPSFAGKRPAAKPLGKKIRIGLIGFFRYRKPIEMLLQLASESPNSLEVLCYGDGPDRDLITQYEQSNENIRYFGTFRNPEDLARIYDSIDVNYVVYDGAQQNVRLAIPNKLYESAFFHAPLLCCRGTTLGRIVEEWKIGLGVDISDLNTFRQGMRALSREWVMEAQQHCESICEASLIDDGDKVVAAMFEKTCG